MAVSRSDSSIQQHRNVSCLQASEVAPPRRKASWPWEKSGASARWPLGTAIAQRHVRRVTMLAGSACSVKLPLQQPFVKLGTSRIRVQQATSEQTIVGVPHCNSRWTCDDTAHWSLPRVVLISGIAHLTYSTTYARVETLEQELEHLDGPDLLFLSTRQGRFRCSFVLWVPSSEQGG